jgi:predicted nucleotidyltransferase
MLSYGIDDTIWERILSILKAHSAIEQIILFGSRAKGNFRNGSDIDLALKGKALSADDILDLRLTLDELNLPWEIDLLHYEAITDPAVKEHIDRVGILL